MGIICSTHGGNENCVPNLTLFVTVKSSVICEVKNMKYKHLK